VWRKSTNSTGAGHSRPNKPPRGNRLRDYPAEHTSKSRELCASSRWFNGSLAYSLKTPRRCRAWGKPLAGAEFLGLGSRALEGGKPARGRHPQRYVCAGRRKHPLPNPWPRKGGRKSSPSTLRAERPQPLPHSRRPEEGKRRTRSARGVVPGARPRSTRNGVQGLARS